LAPANRRLGQFGHAISRGCNLHAKQTTYAARSPAFA
jgi:hypothetical protein